MNSLSPLARGRNAEVLATGDGRALKLYRPGYSMRAIETELRHARIAHALGIPSPRAEGIIGSNGRHGILFERCAGPTLFDLVAREEGPVARLAQTYFDVQRSIHACPGEALPDLRDRLAARIARARRASAALRVRALAALARLPGGTAACHGDFHPANVIMTPDGPVVIDWVDAGRGDPALDVARSLLLLRFARAAQVHAQVRATFVAAYEACLRAAWSGRLARIRRWALPVAVARLAETVDDTECEALLKHISTIPGGSPS
jgi:Ser/Thr protein kinase RdoA (MazF antagonist)